MLLLYTDLDWCARVAEREREEPVGREETPEEGEKKEREREIAWLSRSPL